MKTNLIFKRQITVDGETKVVTRIVPVDIPMINSGEGWTLSGHTDLIETLGHVFVDRLHEPVNVTSGEQLKIEDPPVFVASNLAQEMIDTINKKNSTEDVTKFESDVPGTAKLVRSKGVIKIVARRGKTTYNQTTPNSVCINDFTKNEFFRNCREVFGNGAGIFEFTEKTLGPYMYWSDVIDKEYQRQKQIYLNKYN